MSGLVRGWARRLYLTQPVKVELLHTELRFNNPGGKAVALEFTFQRASTGREPSQLLEIVIEDEETARRIGDIVVDFLSRREA